MAQKIYEDFTPPSETLEERDDATIIKVALPGFKKEELKVKLSLGATPEKIWITGERPMPIEGNIWRRFTRNFPIPPDCDADGITARLVGGILSLKLPKKTASAQKPDERKEPKGQTEPDHQKPTNGGSDDDQALQETKNKKNAEEPAAPQPSVSEEALPKPVEEPKSHAPPQAKGQTNTTSLQASSKVVVPPPEPKPDHHQESNYKKLAEEQESGKPANPQVNEKKAVSEEAPKPEEPKSDTQQANPSEVKGEKESETTGDNKSKEEGDDTENTVKRAAAGYESTTFAQVKLRRHRRKMTNLALMVLAGIGIGIGLYVKNMIRSYGGEAEE